MIWYPSISVFRNGLDAVRQACERVCEEGASRVGSREACRGASPMERDIGAGWDYDEYNDDGDASFGASYTSESQTFHSI